MPAVSFNYWEIDDSIKKAKKTESYLSDYIGDMKSVLSSCKSLTGSDSTRKFQKPVRLRAHTRNFVRDLTFWNRKRGTRMMR